MLNALKILCGVSWKVEGIDNIPKTPCIIVSNHQGQWESFFLQTLIIPSSSIIKKGLLYIPFFGWALACLKPIHLRRRRKYVSMKKVIKDGSKKLKKGTSLIIFPEGTRNDPKNGLKNFSNSCGVLSVNNEVPIIPICHNSGLYWKNKKFIKSNGVVKVIIGNPIYEKDAKEATREAYRWINSKFSDIH
tara:strand:- start:570 stop:1136 length:567 start_codon:yes stop_codon:yes gene_type:complete